MIERNLEPFEDVIARLGLLQLVFGPAPHDLAPELDERLDELEQVQDLGPAADDGEHDDAEARLQRRVLVEIVQNDFGHLAALQLDDDPHPLAIRFVTQIGNPLDRLLAHQVGNPLEQILLVHLIRDLGNHDRDPIALLVGLDRRARPHQNRAAARRVRLNDACASDDVAGRGEVGAGNQLDQLFEFFNARHRGTDVLRHVPGRLQMRLFDQPDAALDDLAQIVRRHVGRHADGDTRRPVHEQIRERRRENRGLLGRLVVVRHEVDGLVVEIRHHVVAERLQPRLGVPHRRRRIAVDRSEVALAVDQRIAHVEVLRQPYERVVDRGVAVGMEVAHHLADDLRALPVRAAGREPHRLHAVQHAAMRRLQPVARVGQRSSDDYAHGVIHVRTLHFVFDVDGVVLRY